MTVTLNLPDELAKKVATLDEQERERLIAFVIDEHLRNREEEDVAFSDWWNAMDEQQKAGMLARWKRSRENPVSLPASELFAALTERHHNML